MDPVRLLQIVSRAPTKINSLYIRYSVPGINYFRLNYLNHYFFTIIFCLETGSAKIGRLVYEYFTNQVNGMGFLAT